MKIATFNVNGINTRLANLLQWLEREQPDIVCLQALKVQDKDFPSPELEAAGYGSLHLGQVSWNGVAILARNSEPLLIHKGLPGEEADTQSRYLEAAAHGVTRVKITFDPRAIPRHQKPAEAGSLLSNHPSILSVAIRAMVIIRDLGNASGQSVDVLLDHTDRW